MARLLSIFSALLVAVSVPAAVADPLNINGFVAATFSPFDEDHRLDTAAIPSHAQWLHDTGVTSVFVCGTTGWGAVLQSCVSLCRMQN